MMSVPNPSERRAKQRFIIERDLRYRVLQEDEIVDSGTGKTLNISSGGVAFISDHPLQPGAFVELSISWPALLDNSCRMKLVAVGRVLRSHDRRVAATIEKYEFRTQARSLTDAPPAMGPETMLRRWVEGSRRAISGVGPV